MPVKTAKKRKKKESVLQSVSVPRTPHGELTCFALYLSLMSKLCLFFFPKEIKKGEY